MLSLIVESFINMDLPLNPKLDSSVAKLSRALFYESQFRNAIVSNSLSFYDINVSKDLIENDFFFRDETGNFCSVLEYVGLSAPCKFSAFIQKWKDDIIPEISHKKMPYLDSIQECLINEYHKGQRDYTVQYWAELKNGKKVYIQQKFLLVKNEDDDICALSIVRDVTNSITTEQNEQQRLIEEYAYYDPVTHGYNYIKFKEKINRQTLSGVIVSLDIHSFKVINSICGIAKGDEVIKTIWNCILNRLEPGELAAHINADHFIIFTPSFDTEEIIQKIKNLTYELNIISPELETPQLQPYFGVSFWSPGKRVELAYSEAVAAKHKSKEHPSLNYAFFEEKDTKKLVEEKKLTDAFEEAIAKKDFKIWYQPKFSPLTKKLVGAEALVRWEHEGELLPPGEFIPLFERNGLIKNLDEYIFRNVCQQQKKWENEGIAIVPVSINLSRASLYYKNVVERYKRITQDVGIETKYIPIEITESAAVNNNDIKEIANDFYNNGFSLHMDDFGSGYSSLASLNILHFETLKLDKSLIDYIGNFGGNRLIQHTVSLAKELGIHVTAEGVETETQVTFLNYVGCDSIQGFYYSKPIPASEFVKMLKISDTESDKAKNINPIDLHIQNFTQNLIKPAIYSMIINLSKNEFWEANGCFDWHKETNFTGNNYDEAVEMLVNNYIVDKYKDAYSSLMNRKKLIENFTGFEETRLFCYTRFYHGIPCKFRLITNTFKTEDSDDIFTYLTISKLD